MDSSDSSTTAKENVFASAILFMPCATGKTSPGLGGPTYERLQQRHQLSDRTHPTAWTANSDGPGGRTGCHQEWTSVGTNLESQL